MRYGLRWPTGQLTPMPSRAAAEAWIRAWALTGTKPKLVAVSETP